MGFQRGGYWDILMCGSVVVGRDVVIMGGLLVLSRLF